MAEETKIIDPKAQEAANDVLENYYDVTILKDGYVKGSYAAGRKISVATKKKLAVDGIVFLDVSTLDRNIKAKAIEAIGRESKLARG